MLKVFNSREAWETEALNRGLIVEKNGYEDVGGPESGPELTYTPDLACSTGFDVEVLGIWIEPIGKGAICLNEAELDAWTDSLEAKEN